MCTVTFIPAGNRFFLTASRDEHRERPAAKPPAVYRVNGSSLLFPKDGLAGGTWFAIQEQGNAVVFLNGAFEKHIPQPPYRKSRGLVLLDLASAASPAVAFDEADLEGIEPFTGILTERKSLFVCKWNGLGKWRQRLDEKLPHIWSSVTLYDAAATEKRLQWFTAWLREHPRATAPAVLDFHRYAGEGNPEHDLRMNRDDRLLTQSICSAAISKEGALLRYLDFPRGERTEHSISFSNVIPANA